MPKLPVVSAKKVLKYLQSKGFEMVGRKGSHVRLKRKTDDETRIVIVPMHSEIAPGTLMSIFRQSGIEKDEFIKGLD